MTKSTEFSCRNCTKILQYIASRGWFLEVSAVIVHQFYSAFLLQDDSTLDIYTVIVPQFPAFVDHWRFLQ